MTTAQQILADLQTQSTAIAALSVSVSTLQAQMATVQAEQAQSEAIASAVTQNTTALNAIAATLISPVAAPGA